MSKNEQLMNTAIAALAAGRKDTARRILTNVVTTDPCDQQAWLYLAVAVPPNMAIPALQKVLVLNPQNEVALQNIYQLRAQPDKELDLADILVGHNQAGDDLLATFGEEPPTIYEPSWWKEQARLATPRNTIVLDEDSTLQRLIARLVNGANTTSTVTEQETTPISTTIKQEATPATAPLESKTPTTAQPETTPIIIKVPATTEPAAIAIEINVANVTLPEAAALEIEVTAIALTEAVATEPDTTATAEVALTEPEAVAIEGETPITPEIEPTVETSPQSEPALEFGPISMVIEPEATPATAPTESHLPIATQPEAAIEVAEPIATSTIDPPAEASPHPEPVLQSSATRYYPKTSMLMEARNEPYIKPISFEGISAVGTVDFVSGNPTALKYMEFRRNIPARVKLKERPVRRNSGPIRNRMQLTNFGIIIMTAMLVIIIGYLILRLIGG